MTTTLYCVVVTFTTIHHNVVNGLSVCVTILVLYNTQLHLPSLIIVAAIICQHIHCSFKVYIKKLINNFKFVHNNIFAYYIFSFMSELVNMVIPFLL